MRQRRFKISHNANCCLLCRKAEEGCVMLSTSWSQSSGRQFLRFNKRTSSAVQGSHQQFVCVKQGEADCSGELLSNPKSKCRGGQAGCKSRAQTIDLIVDKATWPYHGMYSAHLNSCGHSRLAADRPRRNARPFRSRGRAFLPF